MPPLPDEVMQQMREAVEAWLRPIVEKWERQTNARESVTFRLAMKALKADLDALRGGG